MDDCIEQLEKLVADNPDFFEVEVKGLTPLEKVVVKLGLLISEHHLGRVGLEPCCPGGITEIEGEQ